MGIGEIVCLDCEKSQFFSRMSFSRCTKQEAKLLFNFLWEHAGHNISYFRSDYETFKKGEFLTKIAKVKERESKKIKILLNNKIWELHDLKHYNIAFDKKPHAFTNLEVRNILRKLIKKIEKGVVEVERFV